ncbi:MAG: hypothetical protein ACR2RD_08305 [Woeseiaceae bacterium]
MKFNRFQLSRAKQAIVMLAAPVLSSCATHCGLFTYCDIPKEWPINDTFIVDVENNALCVSGTRRSSCANKGMFQSGARTVEIHTADDDDEDDGGELIASLVVNGAPGDHFTASCFQYNGNKFLGFTEVLTGVEIRDQHGIVVAEHPTHPVTRRNTLFFGC